MIAAIKQARSSEEERAAFRAIDRRIGIQTAYIPFDQQGRKVDRSRHKWWESVVMVRIFINQKAVDHEVIEAENIGILSHE